MSICVCLYRVNVKHKSERIISRQLRKFILSALAQWRCSTVYSAMHLFCWGMLIDNGVRPPCTCPFTVIG